MKPVFVGKEQIMSFYDSVNPDDKLACSVWFNDKCILQVPGDMEGDKCRALIETNIEAWDRSTFDRTLWIKFHPAQQSPIDRKTPVLIAQPIGFGDAADDETITGPGGVTLIRGNGSGMNMEMFRAISGLEKLPETIGAAIDTKMQVYEERLKALETPVEPEPSTFAQITGFINANPGIVSQAFDFLRSVLPVMQTPIQPAAPMAINGAPNMSEQQTPPVAADQPAPETREIDNDKLNNALDRLEAKMALDDDLTLLADFADREPQQFNFLLNMLRTQK